MNESSTFCDLTELPMRANWAQNRQQWANISRKCLLGAPQTKHVHFKSITGALGPAFEALRIKRDILWDESDKFSYWLMESNKKFVTNHQCKLAFKLSQSQRIFVLVLTLKPRESGQTNRKAENSISNLFSMAKKAFSFHRYLSHIRQNKELLLNPLLLESAFDQSGSSQSR